ncbi:hypothetical protein K469DRAFT_660398 [Zopfia rhizophila CBS 207.26]|uniref:Uncharacterized protein n=1 Tax=Zopfia rhizophila CBS 207.26 TaxID=1314779 RepID=A0A6A6EA10_9PEZI|nr:hypothetical protein K469DRAFT_660398 [Zopfia rhizophila CBS 207.26]
MRGRIREIILAFSVMAVPMLLFSALLLGLVYHYRITQNPSLSDNLRFEGQVQEAGAVLVRISSTTLITVASWSSTLAPFMVVFALTLASYPVARRILIASRENNTDDLPTPTLVFVTDTWLHFTTKTIAFNQIEPTNISSFNHSFHLRNECVDVPRTYISGCTMNNAATAHFLLDGLNVLNYLVNNSDSGMIKTWSSNEDQFAYLGVPPHPGLADVDYTATTYAVRSRCQPVMKECFPDERISGVGAFYECPFAMEGFLETGPTNTIAWAFFTDSTGKDNSTSLISIQNPYHYAAIVSVNQNIGWKEYVATDPQMTTGGHGSTIFAVFCEAEVYDVEYSSVNNTVTRFVTKQSNSSMANVVQGTQQYTEVGNPFILQASAVAAWSSNSSTEVAEKFAVAYSQAALAVSAGATVPAPPIEAQRRHTILVARVAKAPLFFLVVSNLLLVVLGIILTVLALVAVAGDTGEVQARLSIPALVATHFENGRGEESVEGVEKLFEERKGVKGTRVAVERSGVGGWVFVRRDCGRV